MKPRSGPRLSGQPTLSFSNISDYESGRCGSQCRPECRLRLVEAIGHRRSGRATAIRSGSTELPVGAAQAVPAADGLAVVADFVILRAALAVEEDGLSVSLAPSQAPQAF